MKAKSFRLASLTLRQLSELAEKWGTTETDALTVSLDRVYQQEMNAMTVTIPTETPEPPEWVAAHPAAAYGWKADLAFRIECLRTAPHLRHALLRTADKRFGDAAATERRRQDANELGL